MRMIGSRVVTVCAVLGGVCAGSVGGEVTGNGWTAHRVDAVAGARAPASESGQRGAHVFEPVWVAEAPNCGGVGATLDVLSGAPYTDWGDIAFDTSVRRITLTYGTSVVDVGEPGVPGYGLTLFFFDSFNGAGGAQLVNSIEITGLPGASPQLPSFAVYTLTIELTGDFAGESFELGDTDGVTNTGNFVPFGGVDLDADGLHDFGYAVRFDVPDGLTGATSISLSGPEFAPAPAAQGVGPDLIGPAGNLVQGGTCETPDSDPFLQISISLSDLGQSQGCNEADLREPFGVLDFSDVIAFLVAFEMEEAQADLAPPFGVFDFSDVVAFLAAFGAGCP